MKRKMTKRVISLFLSVLMMIGILPVNALAAPANSFVVVAEAGGKLVIAPEYITYKSGDNIGAALEKSNHVFTGLADGWISEIDGVAGNYTRSDENGNYAFDAAASSIKYFRFSEDTDSQPSAGLQSLMTAMAEYKLKEDDVQAAAKSAYDTAYDQFVGISSSSAQSLADKLNKAMTDYENTQNGTKYTVTFNNGSSAHSGSTISVENEYGKTWEDDGDGKLSLPAGSYTFYINKNGLGVTGSVKVSANTTVKAALPESQWLLLDSFRLSGSYGAETSEENKFSNDEFEVGTWSNRKTKVAVTDTFTGTVYSYVKYDTSLLSKVPTLTAIYTSAQTGGAMEQTIPFESLTSGAMNVLKRGAAGNTVIYRVSNTESDGYTYYQDYTVEFGRVPTLTSILVEDANGVDQAATEPFDGDKTSYVYKILDTVTSVKVTAEALDSSYTVKVGSQNASSATVQLEDDEETAISISVNANGYTNTYKIAVRPGEGKQVSFVTDNQDTTLQVVNANGMVMPYDKVKEGSDGNRYKYVLVPGETYSYVATEATYYHLADEFKIEDLANSTINVSVPKEDWLTELALGTKESASYKGKLSLNKTFNKATHNYEATYVDTEHLVYVWVNADTSYSMKAIYNQLHDSETYFGKEYEVELTAGASKGTQLKRFLMDENPFENTVTFRISKEVDGVTQYQDYVVDVKRTLSLADLTAKCDGAAVTLQQISGTTGFATGVKEYNVTVSMAAMNLDLFPVCHTENKAYGEEEVGYFVSVGGIDVTNTGVAHIELDGTINTQVVKIKVENEKSTNGTTEYVLNILKSPPVETTFNLNPSDALVVLYEVLSGERVKAASNGTYQLCEGYKYDYSATKYGYVGKSGTLEVTRDSSNNLVIKDGSDSYKATGSSSGGGTATISWTLSAAEANSKIDVSLKSEWSNFRGDESNNAVTNAPIPTAAEDGTLYWANQIGSGIDADAVGSPILVDDAIITYASDKIYRINTITGQVEATGTMDHKSSFSITPPTYAEGMVFVALSNGTVQAFNAETLESLWIYTDELGGQPNCPLTVKNGYLYTGFWNSETGEANFVCLSITDENPSQTKEVKPASWHYTQLGGYYWAGAYASNDFILVGTDDGTSKCTSKSSSLLLFDAKTGVLLDSLDGLTGDIRSTIVYDDVTDSYYFTSKGGVFYCVKVAKSGSQYKLSSQWNVALSNGTTGTPMSTCSPVVYNGRAYVGVSGSGQFSAYSGHNITVIDLSKKAIAYRIETQGYPQTSGLLTTAYEEASGYVYVYFFDNMTPGKLRVLRDKAGQTKADYVTKEDSYSTAYALFTPVNDQAQYAICSPITDSYGTVYFKNDSAHLMAFGSAIKKIEVTTNPKKMNYKEGEVFDPTGMVVTATYANGKTRDITKYVTYAADPITASNTQIAISFPYVMYHNEENGTAMNAGVTTTTPVATLKVTIGEGEVTTPDVTLGDVNNDGKINAQDANLVISYSRKKTELTDDQLASADVNSDGKVNAQDANLLISYARKKITEFPTK